MARPGGTLVLLLLVLGPATLPLAHVVYAVGHSETMLADALRFLRYLIAPALLCAAYLSAVILLGRFRVAIAFVGYAIGAVVLALELYAHITWEARTPAEEADAVRVLRSSGFEDAQLSFQPRQMAEELGEPVLANVPNVPTVLCWGDGKWHVYDAGARGFNNPEPLRDPEIAVVGDSFVQGMCLDEENSIVGRMRELLGVEIANFGMQGYGPLSTLATLRQYVAPLRPEIVVWCHYETNDFADLAEERKVPWLLAALDADSPPLDTAGVDALRRALQTEMQQAEEWRDIGWLSVLGLRMTATELGVHYGAAVKPEHFRLWRRVMQRAKETVEGWGGQLHLCYLPEHPRWGLVASASRIYDQTRLEVREIASELGIPVADVAEQFENTPDPRRLFHPDDPLHYDAEGSAIAAREIVRVLRQHADSALGTPKVSNQVVESHSAP